LKKLTVSELAKKSPYFMRPEGSLPCTKSLSLDDILSQLNPVHSLTPYFCDIHFITDLPSKYTSQKPYLPFRFCN